MNASAKHSRRFTENDINFLKSIANVLAAAIERKQTEDALHRSGQAAQKSALEKAVMAEIGRIVGSTLTIEDVYERFSEEARKIISFDRVTITRILPEKAAVQTSTSPARWSPNASRKWSTRWWEPFPKRSYF